MDLKNYTKAQLLSYIGKLHRTLELRAAQYDTTVEQLKTYFDAQREEIATIKAMIEVARDARIALQTQIATLERERIERGHVH